MKYSSKDTVLKIKEIESDLRDLIYIKKVYKNPDLTLYSLANQLQTNTSYLSHVINSKYGVSFNNFINSFRIKDSIYLLKKGGKVDNVAKAVGFKYRSVFYSAFKKNLSMTPREFKYTYSHVA